LEHTVLDLSGAANPQVGDEVVLIGKSGSDEISLSDWGGWLGVGALEVVLNFSGRVFHRYANPADSVWGRFAATSPSQDRRQ
jgi:alanine racemase